MSRNHVDISARGLARRDELHRQPIPTCVLGKPLDCGWEESNLSQLIQVAADAGRVLGEGVFFPNGWLLPLLSRSKQECLLLVSYTGIQIQVCGVHVASPTRGQVWFMQAKCAMTEEVSFKRQTELLAWCSLKPILEL